MSYCGRVPNTLSRLPIARIRSESFSASIALLAPMYPIGPTQYG